MGSLLLGIDLGTTAVKGAAYRVDGALLASASCVYELSTPAPSVVEVSTSVCWSALAEVVRSLLAEPGIAAGEVAGLALSCQGETLVPVDRELVPLRDAIVWLDNRADEESADLGGKFGTARIYEVTGQPAMLPTWPAAKALWLCRHEPQVMDQMDKLLLLEDYVIARLTGEYVCEGSLVTSTCYWDFRKKAWWSDMLDALGLSVDRLPTLVEPGTVVGTICPAVAEELGLTHSTQVCTGALDQACGAIGVGNTAPGVLSENTGTAVALCATLADARLDPEMRMPCHYHGLPDTYMFHTFTSGGVMLRWFRDEFCAAERQSALAQGRDPYDLITAEAAVVPPGSEGLVVLPHLQGAMAPESNPDARGALIGLTLRHGREHVARAIIEAVAFVIRRNIEVLEDLGVPVYSIRALGGGSRSALWKQIEADVTGRPVYRTGHAEAATLGAAILAGVALGNFDNVDQAVGAMVKVTDVFEPDATRSSTYDQAYAAYLKAYDALCPVFER
jgi:sugar (pentulose or hexulose) kinase